MRLGSVWAVIGLAVGLLAGCVSGPAPRPETYVVQPSDTLYSIAWRFDLNYRDLAAWNDLGPANRLTPGQILMLRAMPGAAAATALAPSTPPVSATTPAAGAPLRRELPRAEVPQVERPRPLPDLPQGRDSMSNASPSPSSNSRPGAPPPAATAALAPSTTTPPSAAANPNQPLTWSWPTKVLRRPAPVPGGGVLMLGSLGQDVLAAASGRVVYVGSGIRGYGNLVIIKHSDNLLSAYAHNREVAVRENQQVKAGERIGAMGLGPRQVPALYFEIRVNGKPADVFSFLRYK